MIALNNKIILKIIKKEENTGLLAVVDIKKDSLLIGEVISSGSNTNIIIDTGDKVLFCAYGYEEYDEYVIVTDDMLYAKL